MQYFKEIIMFISWPLLIYIAYKLSRFGLRVFEKNIANK